MATIRENKDGSQKSSSRDFIHSYFITKNALRRFPFILYPSFLEEIAENNRGYP